MVKKVRVRGHTRWVRSSNALGVSPVRVRSHTRRLYRGRGTKGRERKAFERRYGKRRGDYIYGAVVGKVKRERAGRA